METIMNRETAVQLLMPWVDEEHRDLLTWLGSNYQMFDEAVQDDLAGVARLLCALVTGIANGELSTSRKQAAVSLVEYLAAEIH